MEKNIKIIARNTLFALLGVLSISSYVYLSSIDVNKNITAETKELSINQEQIIDEEIQLYLPDLSLVQKALGILQRAMCR